MPNKSAAGNIRKHTRTVKGKEYTTWEARVTVGRDTGTGKQKQVSIYGQTQKEVREKMTALLKSIDDGTYKPKSKITVSEWLDEWLNTYCANKVKPLTIDAYSGMIKNHIKPAIGAMELQAVKGINIQKIYNGMTKNGLSSKTVRNLHAILHKAFSIAIKQGIIQFNPCDAVELPKVAQKEIKPLSDDDIPRFLQAIDDSKYRNAYALCLFAGLRENECLGLSWDNVDFKNGKITISQQLYRRKEKGSPYYIANYTKGNKARVITPPAIAFQYLNDERIKQTENRFKARESWNNEYNLVFTNEAGGNIIPVTFYKNFKTTAERLGVPEARPHDLRHTAATVAIASGADIKSVQSLLGHATASFTLNVYAHTSEKMMQDTADRMQSYYDNLNLNRA